ncbi:MAG TPA: hypothetical protein VFX48_06110, partial [Saprospiraceae bacterium]|nr:hypothetical protein [Saprospiraceae bacterium]
SGKDPLKKSQAAQDIIKTIAKVDEPVKRSIYLKQTAAHLQLDELPLIEACNQLIREELRNRHFQEKRNALERDKEILKALEPGEVAFPRHHQLSIKSDEFQEKDICRILMLWGHKWYDEDGKIPYASYIIENISDTIPFFENDFIRQLILDISGELSSGRIPDLNFFLNHPNKKISELALDLTLSKHEYSSNWEARYGIFLNTQDLPERNYQADITYAILRFKLKKYNKAIEELEAKLKENSLSEEALEIELKSHLHIVNERNYIAGLLNTVVI